MAKELLKGNVAAAEAAVRAGMNFFAGYPITPSTEILEYLSSRLPEVDRSFIQAENEVSAINMIMGAAAVGARALTASSGPGMSLKASGQSYAARYELPYVIINVQRWGTGLGSLESGQADYFRETRGAGHGEYRNLVLAPNSIQELIDMVYNAWDYAEKYRIGVTILSEAQLGQMMENVELPEFKSRTEDLDWGLDGTGDKGLMLASGQQGPTQAWEIMKRYNEIEENEQQWESLFTDDAETVFVAFGLPSRSTEGMVRQMRWKGDKVGLIRPKTLWPFPVKAFEECRNAKRFISVETNTMGEMVEDVALSVKKLHIDADVYCYAYGPGVPQVKQLIEEYRAILDDERKVWF